MVDLAISIVNYNTREDTLACLDSLFRDLRESTCQVKSIIVDHSPVAQFGKDLKNDYPDVEILSFPQNQGFGAGHNRATAKINARYYLILNPDISFPENDRVIERMIEWMETHPEVGMVGPKLLDPDGQLQTSCYRFLAFGPNRFEASNSNAGLAGHNRSSIGF